LSVEVLQRRARKIAILEGKEIPIAPRAAEAWFHADGGGRGQRSPGGEAHSLTRDRPGIALIKVFERVNRAALLCFQL
jgi:hypothetical protein